MPVNKDYAVLLLPRNMNVVALYSKETGVNTVVEIVSLFKPAVTGGAAAKHCSVTIWLQNNKINIEHYASATPPPVRIEAITRPDLWLDGARVVIGVGDMRDIAASLGSIDLSTIAKGDLVLEHVDDHKIAVRCTQAITLTALTLTPAYCS